MNYDQLEIKPATEGDFETLQRIQSEAFQEDIGRYPERKDCPAYETLERLSEKCRMYSYYAFWLGADSNNPMIIGGAEVRLKADGVSARIGRIYIGSAFQNKHLGRKAMLAIEDMHPQIREWTLDTPYLNYRNHHFYEKLGYVKIGETVLEGGFVLFDYSKKIQVN